MREILFKAKRLDNSEWFEGVPVNVTPIQCFAEPQREEVLMVRAGFADWGMPRGLEGTKVDPTTVCQYTGLTDKNGVKIFEGDNVRFAEWKDGEMCWIGKLIYQYGLFAIKGGPNKECDCDFLVQLSRVPNERIEVIGNIHDKED